MKLLIIHPGIQHAPRLANGGVSSGLFEKVTLLTSILFKPDQKKIGLLKKRIKPIDNKVHIVNHYLYTVLFVVSRYLYNKIIINPHTQSHNNPIYFWQQIFGLLCLPRLYLQRKNTLIVCFETTGWPIVKYSKKWNIPVIMDFASISHEKAKSLGINETKYGINLKVKERGLIDYGFYCSEFCQQSFEGLTSARKDFVLYLGAERWEMQEPNFDYQVARSINKQDACFVGSVEETQERRAKSQDACSEVSLEEGKGVSSKNHDARVVGKENREASSKTQEYHEAEGSRSKVKSEETKPVKLSFIANLEHRKGLDIFLESIYAYDYPVFLEVHLIGRIREEWVNSNMPKQILNKNIKLIYKPAMSQQELFDYLAQEQFDLNVQCSRFDSFAMVVPETMMHGIANVVSPFVGAGEMLKNRTDGFIMEQLDSRSLQRILNQYIALNNQEREELKARVLNSSKEMVWENYYTNLALALKEIIADLS